MKRNAAKTIFRAVMFAAAVLGTGAACGKKKAPAAPAAAPAEAAPVETPTPTEGAAPDGETKAAEDPDQGGE